MYRVILLAILFVLAATLQVYLCKRENRKIGLILPTLFAIASILAAVGICIYAAPPNLISLLFTALQVLIMMNVPTAIFAGIYILYHGRK